MMVYACISPLLMPFCVLFFSASYMMYKYQLLYVYVNAYQSGGEMWYMVFSKSILGLMFAACAMLSFFSLDVMNSYSHGTAPAWSSCRYPSPSGTSGGTAITS